MKKGFTLIELLAVIVILAIIALIATPIILGIINDAREESNERSVELYASAVRNAIASYQLTHPNAPETFDDLDVQYDGNVVCTTEELYADGSFYIAECTVNGTEVEYTYGTEQETQINKLEYYLDPNSLGKIGEELPSEAHEDASGGDFYLKLNVDNNNKVTAAYACFVRDETEYCIKGHDTESYEKNKTVLETAFKDVEDACIFSNDSASCNADGWNISVYSTRTGVENYDSSYCEIYEDGTFECSW